MNCATFRHLRAFSSKPVGEGNLLLEKKWSETSVERSNTLSLEHLRETTNQALGISWLRNKSDTGSLKRAKGDISKELCSGGGSKVNGSAVVGGVLEADKSNSLLLEELVSSELEGALEEVSGGGWAETGQQGGSTLLGDDGAEAADEAAVVGDWVELDAGLDAVDDVSCGVLYLLWQRRHCLERVASDSEGATMSIG